MFKGSGTLTVGRRKSSTARVILREGEGKIFVNKRAFEDYFGRKTLQMIVRQPLALLKSLDKYDVHVNVNGGGLSGQAGAIRLGIARALDQLEEGARTALKPAGFLTRDQREVERKKPGLHKARKRPQFSKR